MPTAETHLKVRDLLDGLSESETHALCVEALQNWHAKHKPGQWTDEHYRPSVDVIQMHGDLGRELVPLLAKRKGLDTYDTHSLKEPFLALYNTWMSGVAEFIWWFVRAGLGEVTKREDKHGYPVAVRVTARGIRFLSDRDDHPMLPGFLDRVRLRCPNLPDGVESLLVDARACHDVGLLRPAVVLMGVAYELAIEHVVDALVTKALLHTNTPTQKPAEKIARILKMIRSTDASVVLPTTDERTAAERAYDFADTLRLRRNDAAHTTPRFDFAHRGETEEFLISAGRHLPALWSLAR
ncbi:MAG: hypothetical protein JWP01_3949 [Myxococcales bacterium]|nr:hypothetical protein [Myxococcales bacterium]